MDRHKLAAIIGVIVIALSVFLILPFVSDNVGTGKAVDISTISLTPKVNEDFNTLTGAQYVTGGVGESQVLDVNQGTGFFVGSLNLDQTAYSISFRLKVNAFPLADEEKWILYFGGGDMRISLTSEGLFFRVKDVNDVSHAIGPVSLTENTLTQITAIRNGDQLSLYADGRLVSGPTDPRRSGYVIDLVTAVANYLFVGYGTPDLSADALLDDLILFEDPLSNEDVALLFAGSTTGGTGDGTVTVGQPCVVDSPDVAKTCAPGLSCSSSSTCVVVGAEGPARGTGGRSSSNPDIIDTDGDGLVAYYDFNDNNANVLYAYQSADGSIDSSFSFDTNGDAGVTFDDIMEWIADQNEDGVVNSGDFIFLFDTDNNDILNDAEITSAAPYFTVNATGAVTLIFDSTTSVPSILSLDTDSDGAPDIADMFPNNPYAISDTDGDRFPDALASTISSPPSDYVAYFPLDEVSSNVGGVNYITSENLAVDTNSDNTADNYFNGALTGTTVSDDGVQGKALEFNGVNDKVEVSDYPSLRLGNQQTVAVWYKWDGTTTGWQRLVGKGSDSVGGNIFRNYGLWIRPDEAKILFQIQSTSGGSTLICSPQSVFDSFDTNWHHLAGTYDGTNLKLYFDGALLDTEPCTMAPPSDSSPLVFGFHSDDDTHDFFSGLLDEVYIYSKPLSISEIQSLAAIEDLDDDGDGVLDTIDAYPYDATRSEVTLPPRPTEPVGTTTGCSINSDCSSGEVCRIPVDGTTGSCFSSEGTPGTGTTSGPSAFTSFLPEDSLAKKVTTATEAGGVIPNYASWGFEKDTSSVRTTPSTGITYFNFQGKTYSIDILEFSGEDNEAKLGIRELGQEDYLRAKKVGASGSSDKVTLNVDKDALEALLPSVPVEKPLIPVTVSLDLGGSNEPEFYVHFAGTLGSLDVLVTMSPLVDLSLYPSGSMIMESETPLQFRYTDGTYHTITYIDTGSDYVIAVDGRSHIASELNVEILDHLGSPDEDVGVKIKVVSRSTIRGYDYAVVTLEPIKTDLSASYTGVFDKLTRALTLTIETDTVTYKICADDPLDLEFVRVCDNNNVFQFGLTVNTPFELGDIMFHYSYPESRKPKEVKAYRLLDLSDPDTEILETGYTFSSNLVLGQGLAFKVTDMLYEEPKDEYYLLTLPEDAETMNFEELIITPLSDLNLQPPLPQSDKQQAIFNLPVERRTEEEANRVRQFNVVRIIDNTNVNYQLSAVTMNKVVNLKRSLQTSVDTFGGADVWLEDEEIGLIGVASTAQDTSPEFAELYIADPEERTLVYENRPTVYDSYPNLLFIYSEHRANRDHYHSKKIDVHLLYQLGEAVDSGDTENRHKYTDEDFNIPLMKGYKMALEVAGNYYLLSYNPNKPWTGKEFFDINELRLTRVGASETITKSYDSASSMLKFILGNNYAVNVHFNLADLAEKVVEFDYDAPQGTFLAFTPESEFEAELPDQSTTILYNWLKVGEDDIYRNCDTVDYLSFTTKLLLCDDERDSAGNDGEIVKVMTPIIRVYETGKEVLITFREAYAGRKTVTFQYIWEELNLPGGVNSEELRWSEFNTLLSQDKNPIVLVDGDYFEIRGGQSFADLSLQNLTSGEEYLITHYVQNEGEDQGMVLVGETIFTFEQNDNLGNVEIMVGRADYLYVDAEGFILGEETMQRLITKVDAEVKDHIYTLTLTPIRSGASIVGEQVRVQRASGSSAGSLVFSGNVPLMVTKEILLPNGDTIKVKPYVQVVGGVPQVQVKVSK